MKTDLEESLSLCILGIYNPFGSGAVAFFVASAVILFVLIFSSATKEVTRPPGRTKPSLYKDPIAFLKSFLLIP